MNSETLKTRFNKNVIFCSLGGQNLYHQVFLRNNILPTSKRVLSTAKASYVSANK